MPKTFKQINIKYLPKTGGGTVFTPTNINFDGYWIEVNPNDTERTLDVAVHILQRSSASPLALPNTNSPLYREYGADDAAKWESNMKNAIIVCTANGVPVNSDAPLTNTTDFIFQCAFPFDSLKSGNNTISAKLSFPNTKKSAIPLASVIGVLEDDEVTLVKLERAAFEDTKDIAFWKEILDPRHSINFRHYQNFIDTVLCKADAGFPARDSAKNRSPFIASEEYNVIKFATEAFMLKTLKLDTTSIQSYLGTSKHLPYFNYIMDQLMGRKKEIMEENDDDNSGDECNDREYQRQDHPFMVELIWSYWMEQGMLVQTMNMVNLRFQNIKVHRGLDPLMRIDAGPLRPLSHILWGYIQDEQHRLSLTRRVYEYDHEYGLTLTGRAVGRVNGVDTRVRFLEAFHNLLNACILFYREYDNTTIVADGFPILTDLREVHLLLAEGNHNAYGDLTWTARHEMLVQQYILARPELREFLGGRVMVPYPEKWMDRVDTMRSMQNWGPNDILSYYELAVHGEKTLLSIRYGNWSDVSLTQDDASNWAVAFRNAIQRYVHAYRVVTGVDLSAVRLQEVRDYATQPAFLIQERFGRKDIPIVRPKQIVRARTF